MDETFEISVNEMLNNLCDMFASTFKKLLGRLLQVDLIKWV